jgi:hypothetical protein
MGPKVGLLFCAKHLLIRITYKQPNPQIYGTRIWLRLKFAFAEPQGAIANFW